MSEKLQKIMARAGLGSRRTNEKIIADGRVRINGEVARLGARADQHKDRIEVDGKLLKFPDYIYIKLYKEKGILSSTEDELDEGRCGYKIRRRFATRLLLVRKLPPRWPR